MIPMPDAEPPALSNTSQSLPYHSFLSFIATNAAERFPAYRLVLDPSDRFGKRGAVAPSAIIPMVGDAGGAAIDRYIASQGTRTRGQKFLSPGTPAAPQPLEIGPRPTATTPVLDTPLQLVQAGSRGDISADKPTIAENHIFARAFRIVAWQHYGVTITDDAGATVVPRAKDIEQAPMLAHGVILFNVILALEYTPTQAEFTDLLSAFRSASDLLQDVTNGLMAIGQVVVGGREWMPYADVQILASNRLYPRAGIRDFAHADLPLSPVRLGRGLWHRELHYPIAWREAEGVRVLVHEWLHYALGLPDLYDHTITVANQDGTSARVTLPLLDPNVPSVMSHLVGVSELQERLYDQLRAAKGSPFELPAYQVHEGPDRLTLPLPRVYYALDPAPVEQVLTVFPPDTPLTQPERCWFYLRKAATSRLVPQGSLDRRSVPVSVEDQLQRGWTDASTVGDLSSAAVAYRFTLCDAATGDTLVAVIERPVTAPGATPTTLWETRLTAVDAESGGVTVAPWHEVTPDAETHVVVRPLQRKTGTVADADDYAYDLEFTVLSPAPPTALTFYPADTGVPLPVPIGTWQADSTGPWTATLDVEDAVDGYVLAHWGHNAAATCCIVSVSQGGPGPGNNGTDGGPPHSAGSADGDLGIFMHAEGTDTEHAPLRHADGALIKILTTRHPSFRSAATSSPVFGVAPTHPLPVGALITLVLYCERRLVHQRTARDRWVHWRPEVYHAHNGGEPLPVAYDDPAGRFIALRLTPETAPALFGTAPGVESFQLRWVPYTVGVQVVGPEV